MAQNLDLRRQISLAVSALEAIRSHAEEAGVITDYKQTYDDWEQIVDAVFSAFVLDALFDGDSWKDMQFHKLGFKVGIQTRVAIFADYDGEKCLLFDIVKGADNRMKLLLHPFIRGTGKKRIFAQPDECLNFRMESLPEFEKGTN